MLEPWETFLLYELDDFSSIDEICLSRFVSQLGASSTDKDVLSGSV